MQYALIILAIQMAFYMLCSATYYYGWADDYGTPQRTKPRSPERLVGVKIMAVPMIFSFILTIAIIL